MARFMDFHEDLKLPAEALAQIAEDARHRSACPGVRTLAAVSPRLPLRNRKVCSSSNRAR